MRRSNHLMACMAFFSWLTAFTVLATVTAEQLVFRDGAEAPKKGINVAIIGAGAAGSSTAYHLSQFAQTADLPLNLTIFERNDYIGGRSITVNAYNDTSLPVELGASIFVEANSILVDAVHHFNLSTSASSKRDAASTPSAPQIGVWDGERFHVTYSGSWWDLAKLFWKYGWAPLQTQNLMKKTVGKFKQMYDAPVFPFASITQAAQDVGLLAVTAATGEQYMRENGIRGPFGRDVVQASTRVNYAQNLAFIHGLEAMVCMATDGAMQVEGGNWRIFDQMVRTSGADAKLEVEVTGIERQDDGSWSVASRSTDKSLDERVQQSEQSFHTVVLATPYQFSNIPASSLANPPDTIPYVSLHVTLFTSPHVLSPSYFNLPPDQLAPLAILTTLPPLEAPQRGPLGVGTPGFFSISLLRPIHNPITGAPEYLYKIFSPLPPNETFIASILDIEGRSSEDRERLDESDVTWIYRKVWYSYPYEYPRVTFEDAKVEEGLWYTGGMDPFISTMETNALMGKNVAALIVDEVIRGL